LVEKDDLHSLLGVTQPLALVHQQEWANVHLLLKTLLIETTIDLNIETRLQLFLGRA
jgi:hypothetical protein